MTLKIQQTRKARTASIKRIDRLYKELNATYFTSSFVVPSRHLQEAIDDYTYLTDLLNKLIDLEKVVIK